MQQFFQQNFVGLNQTRKIKPHINIFALYEYYTVRNNFLLQGFDIFIIKHVYEVQKIHSQFSVFLTLFCFFNFRLIFSVRLSTRLYQLSAAP